MTLSPPVEEDQKSRAIWLVGFLMTGKQNHEPPWIPELDNPAGFGRGDTGGTIGPKYGDRHASQDKREYETIIIGWRWKWSWGEPPKDWNNRENLFLLDPQLDLWKCLWGTGGETPWLKIFPWCWMWPLYPFQLLVTEYVIKTMFIICIAKIWKKTISELTTD